MENMDSESAFSQSDESNSQEEQKYEKVPAFPKDCYDESSSIMSSVVVERNHVERMSALDMREISKSKQGGIDQREVKYQQLKNEAESNLGEGVIGQQQ
jgi:hypothetical protein